MKFECHITLDPKYFDKIKEIAKWEGFHISFLVGDEIMGDHKLMYLTKSSDDDTRLINDAFHLRDSLVSNSVPYLRLKIEKIEIDQRPPVDS